MGQSRPFTGEHYWKKDVGIYSCSVCTQNLFMSDHKFESKSGFPTFWNSIRDSLDYKVDKLERATYGNSHEDTLLKNKMPVQRCICSNCEAHLGYVYDDGPGPLYKRIQISDPALNFTPKPWFTIPEFSREKWQEMKKIRQTSIKGSESYFKLINDENFMGIKSYAERVKEERDRRSQAGLKKGR